MIRLDAATVLLQWATGGILFLAVTGRRHVVGAGFGWLLRSVYLAIAVCALVVGRLFDPHAIRDASALTTSVIIGGVLAASLARRKDPAAAVKLDVIAASAGAVGLIAAATSGGPAPLAVARTLVGAAFLGCVTDAMLLGHWYLVQPRLERAPLRELNRLLAFLWPLEVGTLLWPTGMLSVLSGRVDDGFGGLLGWFWIACALTTIALCGVTAAVLRERAYSALMAATGLLYLSILTGFGTDLVARALLAPA